MLEIQQCKIANMRRRQEMLSPHTVILREGISMTEIAAYQ